MTINQRVRPSSLDVGWELFPDFVFRTTGFPYEWLQELQCPDTLTQAQAFLALEQEQKRLRDQFAESLFPSLLEFEQKREPVGSKVFSKLFKLKKRLLKNQALSPEEITFWESRQYENTEWEHFAVKWNRLHSELEKAFTLGEDIFALELARVRRVMKAKVEEPRFQEAVFLSSPSSFQQLHKYLKDWQGEQPPAWNSPARGVERMIFAYLQRFCSKNDTTSFFGPVNYGRFDADQPCSIRRSFHDGNDLGRRRVFIAHWFVQLVAQKLAGKKKVLLCLKPRANPLVRPLGDGKFHFHGLDRSFRLPDAQSRLLLAIDGEKTVSQIAKELQMEEEGIIDLLKEMQKKRLIQVSFPLSPVRVDALAELADHLGELPPEVRQAGEELIQRLEGYRSLLEQTPYPQRVEVWAEVEKELAALVEKETYRKGGALYADRAALYEDCAGTLSELKIGGSLYRSLTGPFLTTLKLLTAGAVLKWLDYQEAGKKLYNQLAKKGSTVRYIDMIPHFDPGDSEMMYTRQFHSRLADLLRRLRRERPGHELQISDEEVSELLKPFEEQIEQALAHLQMTLPSPDIMIASASAEAVEQGKYRLILGELHDDCSAIFDGFMAYFAENPRELRARLDRRIQKMPQWGHMATIITERRNKHVTPELPGHTILLSAVSGKEAAFSIPIHQVEVCEIDGRLTLWANDTPLIIYPGDLGSAAHGCFSLPSVVPIQFPIEEPVAEGKRSPRVVIDGVVVQREQWRIPAEGMQADSPALKGFPLFVHMARKQMQFDLPNQFFVKWKPGEKPIGADLSNPWSLEWLVRVADRTEQMVVSEMYPGPEDLWWHDDIGLHTFELRTGYFYDHTAGKRMKQEVRWER